MTQNHPPQHSHVEPEDIPADGGIGSSDSGGGYGLGPGGSELDVSEDSEAGPVGRDGGKDQGTTDRALGNEQGGV